MKVQCTSGYFALQAFKLVRTPLNNLRPLRWRRGSGLDFGSEDSGSIPRLPSPRVGVWQGGKRRLRTSRCPCRGRLGTLKTPSCPCPAAGRNLETGRLSRHYIAEISLNVT